MKEAIEQILAQIKTGELTEAEIQHLTDSIRSSIKEDPSKGSNIINSNAKNSISFQLDFV